MAVALPLVFADAALLVLDKACGLLSVPGRGADKQDCLAAQVQAQYPDALVVHRLDMATSGLIMMARSPQVQRALGDAFAARQVHKRYEAVVAGWLGQPLEGPDGERQPAADAPWQQIDLPLSADWPNRPRSKVDLLHGKPSCTRWRVLDYISQPAPATRLELEPITGRSHQLRVHLLALGHPILGDALYADAEARARSPRLLLHASRLSFTHPVSGVELTLCSPVPF